VTLLARLTRMRIAPAMLVNADMTTNGFEA